MSASSTHNHTNKTLRAVYAGIQMHTPPPPPQDYTYTHTNVMQVNPSFSVALAVLCAGLVLLGFVTTSALGTCQKKTAKIVKPHARTDDPSETDGDE